MDTIAFVLGSKSKDSLRFLPRTWCTLPRRSRAMGRTGTTARRAVALRAPGRPSWWPPLDSGQRRGPGRRLEIQLVQHEGHFHEYREWQGDLGGARGELQRRSSVRSSIKSYSVDAEVAGGEGGGWGSTGLSPSAAAFLVFQGEVDGLAARTSKELCCSSSTERRILLKEAYDDLMARRERPMRRPSSVPPRGHRRREEGHEGPEGGGGEVCGEAEAPRGY